MRLLASTKEYRPGVGRVARRVAAAFENAVAAGPKGCSLARLVR